MPRYDFHCAECDQSFELALRIDQRHEAKCPECGSAKVAQEFRAMHTFVKGGGSHVPASAHGG